MIGGDVYNSFFLIISNSKVMRVVYRLLTNFASTTLTMIRSYTLLLVPQFIVEKCGISFLFILFFSTFVFVSFMPEDIIPITIRHCTYIVNIFVFILKN